MSRGWIGVDLDGTLAEYNGWISPDHIGEPIPEMVERVKQWLAAGRTVKIFTARAWRATSKDIRPIQNWCEEHIGVKLEVTCEKDYSMIELWDDRAVRVVFNTGKPCCDNYK